MGNQVIEYLEWKKKKQELSGAAGISFQIIYFCWSHWRFSGWSWGLVL